MGLSLTRVRATSIVTFTTDHAVGQCRRQRGTIMIADAQPGGRRLDCHFKDQISRQDNEEGAAMALAEAAEALQWDLAGFHANIHAVDLPRTDRGQFIAERLGWPTAPIDD